MSLKHSNQQYVPERSDNHIEFREKTVIKQSNDLSGEIWWYQHIPPEIKSYFPELISTHPPNQYEIELIDGKNLSYLYLEEKMSSETLLKLLDIIENIHQVKFENIIVSEHPDKVDVSNNYLNKLSERYKTYNYSIFPRANLTFQRLFEYFENYVRQKESTPSIIHGDPVFTNILVTDNMDIKLIDMRGKVGKELTILGDKWYDFGKIYQSLIGYDEILLEHQISDTYRKKMIDCFEQYVINKYGLKRLEKIKWITASLLFSLIPLHSNEKCFQYYKLISKLIPVI